MLRKAKAMPSVFFCFPQSVQSPVLSGPCDHSHSHLMPSPVCTDKLSKIKIWKSLNDLWRNLICRRLAHPSVLIVKILQFADNFYESGRYRWTATNFRRNCQKNVRRLLFNLSQCGRADRAAAGDCIWHCTAGAHSIICPSPFRTAAGIGLSARAEILTAADKNFVVKIWPVNFIALDWFCQCIHCFASYEGIKFLPGSNSEANLCQASRAQWAKTR